MNPRKNTFDNYDKTIYNEYMETEDQEEFEDIPSENDELED